MASLMRILPALQRRVLLVVRGLLALGCLGALPLFPGVELARRTRSPRARSAQLRNAPSVNFMMLPLCTIVTLLRLFAIAYSIAERNRRSVPSFDTGLMPMPEVSGKADLGVLLRERLP